MTSSYKDPLSVVDVGDDEENDTGAPVMSDVCCEDGAHEDGAHDKKEGNGAMEKVDVDVRAGRLAPGDFAKIPKGQKNTPASHTGPKGVIKDFNIAKQNLQNVKMMQRLRAEDAMNKAARGPVNLHDATALNPAASVPAVAKKKTTADSDGETDSDLSDFDSDDAISEAAFAQYKAQRVASVQATLPRYGLHQRVTLEELTAIVKHENPYVYVVVHLYQNHVEACGRINIAMEGLASQFPYVHFLRIRSTEAMPNYPDAGLPTLVVYRAGKQVKEFVRVTDELKKTAEKGSTGISDLTLGKLLAAHGVMRMPTGLDDPEMREAEKLLKAEKRPAMVLSIAGLSVKSKPPGATAAANTPAAVIASGAAADKDMPAVAAAAAGAGAGAAAPAAAAAAAPTPAAAPAAAPAAGAGAASDK